MFGNQKGATVGLATIVTALTTLHSAINPAKRFAFATHYNNEFNKKKIALDSKLEAGTSPNDLVEAMNSNVADLIQEYNERQTSDLSTIETQSQRGKGSSPRLRKARVNDGGRLS
jgi:hypothetical protein